MWKVEVEVYVIVIRLCVGILVRRFCFSVVMLFVLSCGLVGIGFCYSRFLVGILGFRYSIFGFML